MKRLRKWLFRLALAVVVIIAGIAAPIVYVEIACTGDESSIPYEALLAPEHHRTESRTLLTYPEWHIVHAYEDYSEIIRTGAPHEFGYLKSIAGFWSSLCSLSEKSSALGDVDSDTKQMVYVIGASFTVELAFKALYEETIGRVFVWLRGANQSPLDKISASQAKSYAKFLQQVPWYKWDFRKANVELKSLAPTNLRDRERRFALGLENSTKASYANVIANAVAGVGADELTLRMVVTNQSNNDLDRYDGVKSVDRIDQGQIIETPRYRTLTHLLQNMADDGLNFVEIAGNDQIMVTVISSNPKRPDALASMPRQGFGNYRHLVLMKVSDLAARLRDFKTENTKLEHVHDY